MKSISRVIFVVLALLLGVSSYAQVPSDQLLRNDWRDSLGYDTRPDRQQRRRVSLDQKVAWALQDSVSLLQSEANYLTREQKRQILMNLNEIRDIIQYGAIVDENGYDRLPRYSANCLVVKDKYNQMQMPSSSLIGEVTGSIAQVLSQCEEMRKINDLEGSQHGINLKDLKLISPGDSTTKATCEVISNQNNNMYIAKTIVKTSLVGTSLQDIGAQCKELLKGLLGSSSSHGTKISSVEKLKGSTIR